MSRRLVIVLNYCLTGLFAVVALAAVGLWWSTPNAVEVNESVRAQRVVPKPPFKRPSDSYKAVDSSFFNLSFAVPPMQLPNLKPVLVYYGPSDRPDIPKDSTLLHFGLTSGKGLTSIEPGKKLYLFYDRTASPPQYTFSPDNKPTPLWLEAEQKDKETLVRLHLKDENGNLVSFPENHALFTVAEREYTRSPNSPPWELGKWRVDGTLLARQRARWFGEDKFLEKHGGEEFAPLANKQRIDFGDGDNIYSAFVQQGDTLIWKDNQWEQVTPGEETLGYPLLQVKRVDERIMAFDLWDDSGRLKINLNLLKSKEPWSPQQIEQDFKFVATRTRSQYVFEIQNERVILRPHDWLVLTDKGWEVLDTLEEIDDYVERKLVGPLFVFDGVVKKDDKTILTGTLFNPSRTESESVELSTQSQPNVTVINVPKEAPLDAQPSEEYTNGH